MICIKNLSKDYKDSEAEVTKALCGIDLELPANGLVVLLGQSGCGKTTLINLLSGLDHPSGGEIYWNHNRIDNQTEEKWDEFRRKHISIMFQNFNLIENLTVFENIRLALSLAGEPVRDVSTHIQMVAEELGISEFLNKKCNKLSGGQKQRAALARAMAVGTELILADEPTGNLDRDNSEKIFEALRCAARNSLVIVVTHDESLARQYADRIIRMSYGNLVEDSGIKSNEGDREDQKLDSNQTEKGKGLGKKDCLHFAIQAMKLRKVRCSISVLIFSLTLLVILVFMNLIFRDDGYALAEYQFKKGNYISVTYTETKDEYKDIAGADRVYYGKNFCDLLEKLIGKDRLLFLGDECSITTNTQNVTDAHVVYFGEGFEKYIKIQGRIPVKEDEVALSLEMINECGGEEVIGNTVRINDRDFLVSGIIEAIGNVATDVLFLENEYDENVLANSIYMKKEAYSFLHEGEPVFISGFGGMLQNILFYETSIQYKIGRVGTENTVISGRLPQSFEEIAIDISLVQSGAISSGDVLGKTYPIHNLNDEKYGRTFWDRINLFDYMGGEYRVVGIVDGDYQVYLDNHLYEKIESEYRDAMNLRIGVVSLENSLHKDISTLLKKGFYINDRELEKVYSIIETIASFRWGVYIFIGVMGLITLLQMVSLYSYSIQDSKKTIGILRTLGARKSDVMQIFSLECVLITAISLVNAIVLSCLVAVFINGYFADTVLDIPDFMFYRSGVVNATCVIVLGVLLGILSVIIPLKKHMKKSIVELVR